MNKDAFAAIGRPARVTLLFDAKLNRIGIKSPVSADNNFFLVQRHGRNRKTLIVRALRLLRQTGLKVDRTIVFKDVSVEKLRGSPMLVVSLEQPWTALTAPREEPPEDCLS